MFNRKTVFILGAGASWHYGYPTGEDLVRKLIEKSEFVAELFEKGRYSNPPEFVRVRTDEKTGTRGLNDGYRRAHRECKRLATQLRQLNPLVIDYFLGHHKSLRDVGRFMIAWVLLECEANYVHSNESNPNRAFSEREMRGGAHKDDWYRFLLHRLAFDLAESVQLQLNQVKFVTFNYDVSLDTYLSQRLSVIESIEQSNVDNFLRNRILHMYGSLRDIPSSGSGAIDFSHFYNASYKEGLYPNYMAAKQSLDEIYCASKRLRVIDPHDKGTDDQVAQQANAAIQDAEVVYILGYGFDVQNSKRLGLFESLNPLHLKGKTLLYKNFQNSNRVSMDAATVFGIGQRDFLSGALPHSPSFHHYLIKSVRDVYDAFALDFNAPEQLI